MANVTNPATTDPTSLDNNKGGEIVSSSSTSDLKKMKAEPTGEHAAVAWYLRPHLFVNESVSKGFGALARTITGYPLLFSLGVVVIIAACLPGFTLLADDTTFADAWVPQNSLGKEHGNFYAKYYDSSIRFNQLLFLDEDEGSNILKKDTLTEMLKITIDINTVKSDRGDTFSDICFNPSGFECVQSNIFSIWNYDLDTFKALSLSEILNDMYWAEQNGTFADLRDLFANLETSKDGRPSSSTAAKFTWFVTDGEDENDKTTKRAEAWELEFLDIAEEGGPGLSIYRSAFRSGGDEISASIGGDVVFLNVSFLLIFLYSSAVLTRLSWVESRTGPAIFGVCTIGISIGMAYGIAGYLGIPFTGPARVVPFLSLGIGVDDMFIIVDAVKRTTTRVSPARRLELALSESGPTILLTSLTDLFVFLVGSATVLPAIQWFAYYAALGIVFDFFLQVTLFPVGLYLDLLRSERGYRACCCCCRIPGFDPDHPDDDVEMGVEESSSYTSSSSEEEQEEFEDVSTTSSATGDSESSSAAAILSTKVTIEKDGVTRWFMTNYYAPFLVNPVVKGVVIAFFVVLAGVSIWGATYLDESFDERDLLSDSSYYYQYIETNEEQYPNQILNLNIVTNNDFDVSDPAYAKTLRKIIKAINKDKRFIPEFTDSWFDSYTSFVALNPYLTLENEIPTPSSEFYEQLDNWLSGPGQAYAGDVALNNNGKVVSTKSSCAMWSTNSTQESVEAMRYSRDLVAEYTDDAFPYTFQFQIFEQFAVIVREGLLQIGVAGIGVLVLTLAFLHPAAAVYVTVTVLLINVDLLGLLYIWDVSINAVSVTNLVIAIGLSVDYSAHVCHRFMELKGTRDERMLATLGTMGASVVNGGVSTFLGVCALGFSKSGVFIVLFKVVSGTVILGLAHGILFLPIVLSLIAPKSAKHAGAESSPSESTYSSTTSESSSAASVPSLKDAREDSVNEIADGGNSSL